MAGGSRISLFLPVLLSLQSKLHRWCSESSHALSRVLVVKRSEWRYVQYLPLIGIERAIGFPLDLCVCLSRR